MKRILISVFTLIALFGLFSCGETTTPKKTVSTNTQTSKVVSSTKKNTTTAPTSKVSSTTTVVEYEDPYTITLKTSANLGATASDKITKTYQNAEKADIDFVFDKAKDLENGLAELALDGTISNSTIINSATDITVEFEGKLAISSGVILSDYCEEEELESGAKFTLVKKSNYVKVRALEDGAKITSIKISYGSNPRDAFQSTFATCDTEKGIITFPFASVFGQYMSNASYYRVPDKKIFDDLWIEWDVLSIDCPLSSTNPAVGIQLTSENGNILGWVGYKPNAAGDNSYRVLYGMMNEGWDGINWYFSKTVIPYEEQTLHFRVERTVEYEGEEISGIYYTVAVNDQLFATMEKAYDGVDELIRVKQANNLAIGTIAVSCEECGAVFANFQMGKLVKE